MAVVLSYDLVTSILLVPKNKTVVPGPGLELWALVNSTDFLFAWRWVCWTNYRINLICMLAEWRDSDRIWFKFDLTHSMIKCIRHHLSRHHHHHLRLTAVSTWTLVRRSSSVFFLHSSWNRAFGGAHDWRGFLRAECSFCQSSNQHC